MAEEKLANQSSEIMTPYDVVEYLKLPLSTVYKLSQEGKLAATKFGKHWRYLKSDIESYLTGLNTMDAYGAATDRRRFPRKVCAINAVFEVNVPDVKKCKGLGTIRNISSGGALLEIGSLIMEGQFMLRGDPVVLSFDSLDMDSPSIDEELHGTILRFEQGERTSVWIQFLETSFGAAGQLVACVAG